MLASLSEDPLAESVRRRQAGRPEFAQHAPLDQSGAAFGCP
jgi:hypothetical protein